MDHLFTGFMSRRASTNFVSSGGIKRMLKRASFGSKHSPFRPSWNHAKSSSKLANIVDEQLMQIKERLAELRQQNSQFRERMDSLSTSISELSSSRSSLSSFLPSECSDLDRVDEFSEEEEEIEPQTEEQKAFSNNPPQIFGPQIPTVTRGTGAGSRSSVNYLHMRQSSDPSFEPSSLRIYIELPSELPKVEGEVIMEACRHRSYSAGQLSINYPQYNNPEEISTLF